MLLAGEPGIGKSRTVSVLRDRLGADGAAALAFHCSPFGVNSAFHPIIASLERAVAGGREEPAEQRLRRLEALVVEEYARPPGDVPLLASILALPVEAHDMPRR